MTTHRHLDALRATLIAALGLTSAACRAGSNQFHCVDPVPILVDGKDTGYDTCAGGTVRRRAMMDCPLAPLPPTSCRGDAGEANLNQCLSNSDCDAGVYGQCGYGADPYFCTCSYGCARDSDCAAGEICQCGDPVGRCVAASCNAGTCGAGVECATYSPQYCPGCTAGFACQAAGDQCFSAADCNGVFEQACSIAPDASARACSPVGQGGSCCGFGRPFLVAREARLAAPVARADWLVRSGIPGASTVVSSDRARLAQRWTEAARMEHASVAAFARFVLQLLALGAPPDLVVEAQRAMRDEIEHARLAFGLASAYAGADVGPGPIAVDACLDASDLRFIVETTFAEGCLGEVVAALEASEALERAPDADPSVRAVLATIAADEARHAELAWRSVAWMVATFGQTARSALERALAEAMAASGDTDARDASDDGCDRLLAHGILSDRSRAEIRRDALRRVVAPLATALLGPSARAAASAHLALCQAMR